MDSDGPGTFLGQSEDLSSAKSESYQPGTSIGLNLGAVSMSL